MLITLGFSPCPNDTFIFDALVNKKIDTEGIDFDVITEDVETLNQWALEEKLEVTKLSFPAFFESLDKYTLLNTGSALGKGVGPILVAGKNDAYNSNDVAHSSIALPGSHTTANLLFSFAYPDAGKKQFMLFSEIEGAVLNGQTDLGVIIHENRFTYQDRGLFKVADLGELWEEKMKLPIPLGGIAISQGVKRSIAQKVERLIRQSLEYAFSNYPTITDYVKLHSQSMSEEVMRQHIDLYVNNYSLDLGDSGRQAIQTLYKVYCSMNAVDEEENTLFL